MAPLLAAKLGFASLDLDESIERSERLSIAEQIRSRGEEAFRSLESRALEQALSRDDPKGVVIACGGGVLGREDNRERLRRAFVLWLQVSPDTAAARIGGAGRDARPLLDGGSLLQRLRSLDAARQELYRRSADATLDTEGRSAAEVAELAAGLWRAWASSGS